MVDIKPWAYREFGPGGRGGGIGATGVLLYISQQNISVEREGGGIGVRWV